MPSGCRKSGITPARSISARQIRHASACLSETCPPRRSGSRGVPSSKPSGASQRVVEVDDERGQRAALLPQAVDPGLGDQPRALLHGREPEDRRRTGEEAADAVDRVVLGPHEELLALPEPAPDRRAQLRLELGRTYRYAGEPGPALRYLYVQPTARSAPPA